MKKIGLALFTLLVPAVCFGYEPSMLNLTVPAVLKKHQAEVSVQHRSFGQLDRHAFQTLFGLDLGVNVGLTLRYPVADGFEIRATRTRSFKEYVLGASYARHLPEIPVSGRFDVQYFTFDDGLAGRRGNVFFQVALQTDTLFQRAEPCLNVGYDNFSERVGWGVGVNIRVINRISLLGEYYPVQDRDDVSDRVGARVGPEDAYAVGIKIQTPGHHFFLLAGNSFDVGTRRLMLGADSKHWYFGFNIQRRLEW